METALLATDELVRSVRQRLRSGWLIVSGDHAAVQKLEECIYTPGTPANADFELIGFPNTIFLAKKTERLRKLLKNPSDFDEIQILTFGRFEDGSPGVVIDSYNPDVLTEDEAADRVAAKAAAFITRGRW